jgi:hypothetical protein
MVMISNVPLGANQLLDYHGDLSTSPFGAVCRLVESLSPFDPLLDFMIEGPEERSQPLLERGFVAEPFESRAYGGSRSRYFEVPIEIIERMHSAVKILSIGQQTWGIGFRPDVPIRSDAAAASPVYQPILDALRVMGYLLDN